MRGGLNLLWRRLSRHFGIDGIVWRQKRRYNERMKTLTITDGRGRLGYWLKKAAAGEDIGFVIGDKIVALRPVNVHSDDYVLQEYGITKAKMKAATKRIAKGIATERRRGTIKPFTGTADALRD
jgi:hypothetical protein